MLRYKSLEEQELVHAVLEQLARYPSIYVHKWLRRDGVGVRTAAVPAPAPSATANVGAGSPLAGAGQPGTAHVVLTGDDAPPPIAGQKRR